MNSATRNWLTYSCWCWIVVWSFLGVWCGSHSGPCNVVAWTVTTRPFASSTRGTCCSSGSNILKTRSIPSMLRMQAATNTPAVLDRPTEVVVTSPERKVQEPTIERKGQGSEGWEVRIYNDGMNTREHVARSLVLVVGMSERDGYQTMMHAHKHGMAIVGRWVYEVAEMYHEALKKKGIVCDLVPVDQH